MRRLVSVFSSRRTDKSETTSSRYGDQPPHGHELPIPTVKEPAISRSKSRFFRSLSRKAHPPSRLANPNDHGVSSSASSSIGPTTPDDDARSFVRAKTFLYPFSDKAPPAEPTSVNAEASPLFPPLPRIALSPSALSLPDRNLHSDDEASDGYSSDGEPLATRSTRISDARAQVGSAQQSVLAPPLSAVAYARAVAANALVPPFSPPPLLPIPNAPLFPRSCNRPSNAPAADALLPQLFHKRVMLKLTNVRKSDEDALAPFAARRNAPESKHLSLKLDDTAISGMGARRVGMFSDGLRRWAERPCFEDRFVVYMPDEVQVTPSPSIVCLPVSGSTGLGVAALEFSEHIEVLAGLGELEEEAPSDVGANAELPSSRQVQFPRAVLPNGASQGETLKDTALHAFPAWANTASEPPTLNVDTATGSLGAFIEGDGRSDVTLTPMLTPPLSLTPSSTSTSPVSSGPSTPTFMLPPAVGNASASTATVKPSEAQQSSAVQSPLPRAQPYKAMPSPLRIEQNTRLPNPWSPIESSSPSPPISPSTSPAPTSASTITSAVTIKGLPASSPVSSSSPASQSALAASQMQAAPKPSVRFAESCKPETSTEASDSDRGTNVPLGYVQRIKQQRLEKARFLAAERARRAQAEEQQRRNERMRQEEEERQRQARERERRKEEEERRQRMYQEELAAARNRRESMRFISPSMATPGVSSDWERERHDSNAGRGRAGVEDTYKRPSYDVRRQSEPSARQIRNGSPAPPSPSPLNPNARNSSPAPSGSGSASGSQRGSSQQSHSHLSPHPAALGSSARSSSAPDVRPRDRSSSASTSNRRSVISEHTSSSHNASPTVPMWMGGPGSSMGMNIPMNMNMNRMSMNMAMMNVPPMPMLAVPMAVPVPVPVPAYGMQMGMEPLLPPSPPFVTQQFGYRPPSQQSNRRDSGSSQGHRRTHNSSPTPPQNIQRPHEPSQPRSHSSSPTTKRPMRESMPPSSSRNAQRASQVISPSPRPEPQSSSSRTQREYTHHRRSSGDVDSHRMSQAYPSPREPSRDRDERRSNLPHSSRPPMPSTSSMPAPITVTDARSPRAPGFQILSRPTQARRQTMIS